jgi:pimeloyl-ACP methyl ester carboxylesterase
MDQGDDVMMAVELWAARANMLEVAGEDVAVLDIPATDAERSDGNPPLLVVHGFPTSSIDFQLVVDRLAETRRVVLLDLPGYGLSDKPDRPYTLSAQADVVAALARHLGLEQVDLLTHDMGDSVGGELLARSLESALSFEVRRRVLTNGSIYLDKAQLTDGQKMLMALPDEMLPEGSGLAAPDLAAVLADLCGPDRTPDAEQALRHAAELVVRAGGSRLLPRQVRYIGERAEHENRWTGAIENHPAPLTVVWGRHDPIAVAGMADQLTGRRAEARLIWLEAGHWPMVEKPEGFADAVLAGLDEDA